MTDFESSGNFLFYKEDCQKRELKTMTVLRNRGVTILVSNFKKCYF